MFVGENSPRTHLRFVGTKKLNRNQIKQILVLKWALEVNNIDIKSMISKIINAEKWMVLFTQSKFGCGEQGT